MRASTSQKIRVDWSQAPNGKWRCKAQIRKFVRGIRGPRRNPVTQKQIMDWVSCTREDFVHECLTEMVATGELRVCRTSMGRRANARHVYEIGE